MADIKFTTVPSKTLSESITSTATSFKLSDIKGWDGSNLTSADFGSKAYGVFRNSNNTTIELFEFDPSTIASASITINYRGLKFDGTLDTEVTANKKAWTKGDTFVDLGTDVPQLLQHTLRTIGSPQIIEQLQYSTELTPTDAKDIVTKGYVDGIVSGGAFSSNKIVVAGDAGETVAEGELVYYSDSENEWMLTDGTTASTLDEVLLGIAQGAGTNGNPISGGILLRGLDETQTGMTVGVKLYAGDTNGTIVESAGTVEKIIGFSKSATELYFDPYFGAFITAEEKAALAGASNTPGGSNKFVTEDDLADPAFKGPVVETFTTASTLLGDSTTQYDITDAGGNTFRYTYDTTGTNPGITGSNPAVSDTIVIAAQNFNAANNGTFTVTASGTNYFEVTNASGVAENDKTIGTGYIALPDTWTKDTGLKYIVVEGVGGGGGGSTSSSSSATGGGGGGYFKKLISASALAATETVIVGTAGTHGSTGTAGTITTFGSHCTANGGAAGSSGPNAGGTATGGDINIPGQSSSEDIIDGNQTSTSYDGGIGGSSMLGHGGPWGNTAPTGYGAGGSGGSTDSRGIGSGSAGTAGIVIVTEYYS